MRHSLTKKHLFISAQVLPFIQDSNKHKQKTPPKNIDLPWTNLCL